MADQSVRIRNMLLLASAGMLGMFLGVSGFTFIYGEGPSYFSKDPAACVNCHIMQPYYDGWQKASHHQAATCVDCHLPHSFLGKYTAKALNGYHHSRAFTFQNFKEPIRIKQGNLQILEKNCMGCHGDMVHGIATGQGEVDPVGCIRCHGSVGHGDPIGIGGPDAGMHFERSRL